MSASFTLVDTRRPSARPPAAAITCLITFPMSRGEVAPVSATARLTRASSSPSGSSAGRYVSITCASNSSPSARSSRAASRYASAASRRRLRSRRNTVSSSASPSFSAFWSSESTSRRAPTRSRSPAFMAEATSDLMRSAICKHLLVYAREGREISGRPSYGHGDRPGPWRTPAQRPHRQAVTGGRHRPRDPALPLGPHLRHALPARPRVARRLAARGPRRPPRAALKRPLVPSGPLGARARQPLLQPVVRVRVVVVAVDLAVAAGPVHGLGLGERAVGVEAHGLVAAPGGVLLERREQPAGDPEAAMGPVDPHPQDLARALVERLQHAAAGRLPVEAREQEEVPGRGGERAR